MIRRKKWDSDLDRRNNNSKWYDILEISQTVLIKKNTDKYNFIHLLELAFNKNSFKKTGMVEQRKLNKTF